MPFASKNVVVKTWLFIAFQTPIACPLVAWPAPTQLSRTYNEAVAVISILAINVYGSGEKRLDLKIGFDITQGANGAPSLRIRDFEESSELNTRAKEDTVESKETKHKETGKVRADSFSDSDEEPVKSAHKAKLESSKESKENAKSNNDDAKSDDDDNDSSVDGDRDKLSTRGLKAGDYEPEENPKIHGSYRESEEDSDKLRRRKRHALFRSKGK